MVRELIIYSVEYEFFELRNLGGINYVNALNRFYDRFLKEFINK